MNKSDITFLVMMTIYSLILIFFIFTLNGTERSCKKETVEAQTNEEKEDIVAYARLFCIYKRVFVEFREDNQVWGTIFLNEKGEVVPCTDDKEVNAIETELQ
jgi:hypothetical protein